MKKSIIKTNIDMDFNKNIVDVYVYWIVKSTKTIIATEENQEEIEIQDEESITGEQLQIVEVEEVIPTQPKLLFSKSFKISDDFESVFVNDKKFEIPSFFNRKTIKEKDLKTWEMIFYCVFEREINAEIRNILSKSENIKDD